MVDEVIKYFLPGRGFIFLLRMSLALSERKNIEQRKAIPFSKLLKQKGEKNNVKAQQGAIRKINAGG